MNWTKIHLIYFALAAFDLAAIALGLWLSEATKSQFTSGVAAVEEAQEIGKHARNAQRRIAEIASTLDRMFVTSDGDGATRIFTDSVARFNEEFSDKAFAGRIAALGHHDHGHSLMDMIPGGSDDHQPALTDTKAGIASITKLSEATLNRLQMASDTVRSTVNQAADTGNMAIAAFKAGDVTAARAANDKVQALLRSGSSVLVGLGQTADDEISAISKSSWGYINRAGLIQYLIGGCILLMILFVCIYAHFVGKILKRKYLELEASEAQSVAFAGKLQEVNDDVTKLNVELAQNVQHLKEAQDEIVRRGKMAQLGQLTATVAHELRNPLAAIRTSTFLMERKVKDKNLGLESQFSRINNGIARCERVISQLLDFARTRSPQLQTISFDEWLQKEIEEEAAKLPEPVAIECHLGAGPLQVAIDPDRMRRAIINLLSNASEAMVGKGDDLSKFTTNTPQIVVETATERGNVFITVSDNGPGMSEEVQKRILEPLFTTKSFGTGLGLPAVEAILHQHGGGLKVESKPGKGARFTAWFPAQHAAQEAA